MMPKFVIKQKNKTTNTRAGVIRTPHGDIKTPAFFPVGTQGTVKALSPKELKEIGVQGLLGNTYHLHLRPGENNISKFGGLAKWMNWDGPTMTDSGGFQVFSLGVAMEDGQSKLLKNNPSTSSGQIKPRLNRITEEGVEFQSHIDGSRHTLTSESSIKIQEKLGADLIVAFDDLESPTYDHKRTRESLELTNRWELRSLKAHLASQGL